MTLALLAIWAMRLAVHLGMRIRLRGEDFRYVKMRDDFEDNWWYVSYFKVFLLQAVLAWAVSLPIYFAIVSLSPTSLTVVDYAGIVLVVCGLAFESVADEHLRRFRADRNHRGALLTTGLWRYTRHPNYFGEALLWWGFGLIGLATGGLPGVIGPAALTYLLLYVTGVPLIEPSLSDKPGYAGYAGTTPVFLPLPQRVQARLIVKVKSMLSYNSGHARRRF